MRRNLALLLIAGLALAACGTPQERCINRATRDLQVVNTLIARLERDLSRGYGMKAYTIMVPRWVPCGPPPPPPPTKPGVAPPPPPPPMMCLDDFPQTVYRPVAIDLAAAQRKLDQLKKKRLQLEHEAQPAIAACKAQYPEKE